MEQDFYRDEFEQLLKENTDDFKMYPSRKVWHSIYNDLHPDRKWPSFAVCLILLTGILYLGVSNNNSINSNTRNLQTFSGGNAGNISGLSKAENVNKLEKADLKYSSNYSVNLNSSNKISDNLISAGTSPSSQTIAATAVFPVSEKSEKIADESDIAPQTFNTAKKNGITFAESINSVTEWEQELKIPAKDEQDVSVGKLNENISKISNHSTVISLNEMKKQQLPDEREWIDDFAFYNKKKEKQLFKGKWATQFYVAPSIGYRVLFRNKSNIPEADNSLITASSRTIVNNKEPNEQGALSIEAGAGIIKEISPRFRIKTGIQFNYSDFITNAQRLDHPTNTTVAINNFYGVTMEDYSSSYANSPGSNNDQLHNKTIQLSIPLGVDYKIMGNNKITWYAGASIQPTYVTGGYAWVQSADNNFYVEDVSLLRRWNFNAGFESFVSFKAPSGASINIGPQFRYQLMSTYTKKYTYTEKPYNIGFKIGLSKPL